MITILLKLKTRSRHTTAGYTLQVFKWEESDQSGAMPREQRHAERRERRGRGSGNLGGAVAGKVHAKSVAAGIIRVFWDPAGTTVTGNDWELGAEGVTQQPIRVQSPQAHLDLAGTKAKAVGADAIA